MEAIQFDGFAYVKLSSLVTKFCVSPSTIQAFSDCCQTCGVCGNSRYEKTFDMVVLARRGGDKSQLVRLVL